MRQLLIAKGLSRWNHSCCCTEQRLQSPPTQKHGSTPICNSLNFLSLLLCSLKSLSGVSENGSVLLVVPLFFPVIFDTLLSLLFSINLQQEPLAPSDSSKKIAFHTIQSSSVLFACQQMEYCFDLISSIQSVLVANSFFQNFLLFFKRRILFQQYGEL